MEWFKLYVKDLSNQLLLVADDAAVGAWIRMLAKCYDLENGGRFEGCDKFSTRQWLSVAGVDREAVDKVVSAGLATWEAESLRVTGYDVAAEQKATERSRQNRELARRRWGNAKGIPEGNAKGIPEGNAKGIPEGNAEGEGEIEEEGEKESDPAGGPSGVRGGGDVLRLLDNPEAKPDRPDSRAKVLSVFEHYHQKHAHPVRKSPQPKSKTWQAVAARLRAGWTVQDLCKAIDGYHLSPHHLGQNDRGTKYLDLELFARSDEHVEKGINYAENPPKPYASSRSGIDESWGRDVRHGRIEAKSDSSLVGGRQEI